MATLREMEEADRIRRLKMGDSGGDFRSAGADFKNLGVALKNIAAAGGSNVVQSAKDFYNAEGVET